MLEWLYNVLKFSYLCDEKDIYFYVFSLYDKHTNVLTSNEICIEGRLQMLKIGKVNSYKNIY